MFGFGIAQRLQIPFILIRKAGKLPSEKIQLSYTLEYAVSTLEIHVDQVAKDQRVVLHDDLLATGGSAACAKKLVGFIEG
jgi:adenine phosphoribosyltransferase